jgi:hypothetical protein
VFTFQGSDCGRKGSGRSDPAEAALRGAQRRDLNDIVRVVRDLDRAGARLILIFPKGVPATEGVVVEVAIDESDLAAVMVHASIEDRIHEIIQHGIGLPAVQQIIAQIEFR